MKTPSRFMPAYVRPPTPLSETIGAFTALAIMLVSVTYAIWDKPLFGVGLLVLVGCGVFITWKRNRAIGRMASMRQSESICTFARSFDRREVDSWIIRAVHEELQPYVQFPGGACPLQASDRLEEDLKIDIEDIEEILPVVAQRAGRSIEGTEANPYYGKVRTVGDLVHFMNCQPRLST